MESQGGTGCRKNRKAMLIAESRPRARKPHDCMACEWLLTDLRRHWPDLTYSEKRAVVRACQDGGKILPGQQYLIQHTYGGRVFIYRARPDIHEICARLIYPMLGQGVEIGTVAEVRDALPLVRAIAQIIESE